MIPSPQCLEQDVILQPPHRSRYSRLLRCGSVLSSGFTAAPPLLGFVQQNEGLSPRAPRRSCPSQQQPLAEARHQRSLAFALFVGASHLLALVQPRAPSFCERLLGDALARVQDPPLLRPSSLPEAFYDCYPQFDGPRESRSLHSNETSSVNIL